MALHLKAKDQNGIVRGHLTKNRNGSVDLDIAFTIGVHQFGHDDDGDPITSAFVEEISSDALTRTVRLSPTEGQHVVARDLGERSVADDVHEILHGLDPGVLPSAKLVFTLAQGLVLGEPPIEIERPSNRDRRFGDAPQECRRFHRVRFALVFGDGLDPLQNLGDRKCPDFGGEQETIAPTLGQFTRGLETAFRVVGVPGKVRLLGFDKLRPGDLGLELGQLLGVGVKALRNQLTRLNGREPFRNPSSQVVGLPDLLERHGYTFPADDVAKMRTKRWVIVNRQLRGSALKSLLLLVLR